MKTVHIIVTYMRHEHEKNSLLPNNQEKCRLTLWWYTPIILFCISLVICREKCNWRASLCHNTVEGRVSRSVDRNRY